MKITREALKFKRLAEVNRFYQLAVLRINQVSKGNNNGELAKELCSIAGLLMTDDFLNITQKDLTTTLFPAIDELTYSLVAGLYDFTEPHYWMFLLEHEPSAVPSFLDLPELFN